MKRALLVSLLVLVGCGVTVKKPSQGVICVWPDPIEFSLAADSWRICFHTSHDGDPPACVTVGQLREIVVLRKLAE